MDQSFSPQNLRRIWDMQTRKGRELGRLFPNADAALASVRLARRTIRRGGMLSEPSDVTATQESTENLKSAAERIINAELVELSNLLTQEIAIGGFSWGLHKLVGKSSRDLFAIDAGAKAYFVDKQLQRSVAGLFEHAPQSRQSIVATLTRTLDNRLPKAIIKVDVEHFYESIDHGRLMAMIRESPLSRTNQGLIEQLLLEYAALTHRPMGLPTGVGLSAQLAEFFIGRMDNRINATDDAMYFARYVDDIILVCGIPEPSDKTDVDFLAIIGNELDSAGLASNQSKSHVYRSTAAGTLQEFELLGYMFKRANKRLEVSLTERRIRALHERLDRTFDLWNGHDHTNTGRQGLLVHRLRFLTGNTRLSNNKRNAMVGIYFSNPHLTELDVLDDLDKNLQAHIANSTIPNAVMALLEPLSFRKGFEDRRMFRLTPMQLRKIRGAWNG